LWFATPLDRIALTLQQSKILHCYVQHHHHRLLGVFPALPSITRSKLSAIALKEKLRDSDLLNAADSSLIRDSNTKN
jgi:hypothetical protein